LNPYLTVQVVFMKTFVIPSAILFSLLCVSCSTNRPAPNDEEGREWAQDIQTSYPDWQPPQEMPAGNPAYDAVFSQPGQSAGREQTAAEPVVETAPATPVAEKSPVQSEVVVSAAEPVSAGTVPHAVEVKTASFARVDIRKSVPLTVNGFEKTEAELEQFLSESAKQNPDFGLIVYFDESAQDDLTKLVAVAKKAGVQKINAMSRDDLLEAQLESVSKNKKDKNTVKPAEQPHVRMIRVVDSEKPASEYVVQKDDSLSVIAKKQYHDGALWPILLEANKVILNNNPDKLKPGLKLSIPVLKSVPAAQK